MDVEAKWIEFQFTDLTTNRMIRIRGFSGKSQQRRRRLRAELDRFSRGRAVLVTKRTWVKGSSSLTAVVEWTKTVPASNKGVSHGN